MGPASTGGSGSHANVEEPAAAAQVESASVNTGSTSRAVTVGGTIQVLQRPRDDTEGIGHPQHLVGRIVAALCHGSFFGVGSVVAAALVLSNRRASAIAIAVHASYDALLLGFVVGH
jgi:hypothetical protein